MTPITVSQRDVFFSPTSEGGGGTQRLVAFLLLLLFYLFPMYILALSSTYLPIPRLMMKNERVLHMLPPHIGLPPTPDRFSDYKQLLLLLHNINDRRRPTVWDLSGSFIYNFFFPSEFLFFFSRGFCRRITESLLQCVCGRLDFHEPTPSSPCHNLRNHFFGIFLCLFIYLFF